MHSRQYLPRKGTETYETPCLVYIQLWHPVIPDNIYPARGRKPCKYRVFPSHQSCIPDNIYPARGRKQQLKLPLSLQLSRFPTIFTPQGDGNKLRCNDSNQFHCEFPTIFTPQGDGNNSLHLALASSIKAIPDNIYPARGRKLKRKLSALETTADNSRQYLPRKGTETPNPAIFHVWRPRYSRQYLPRKGTETTYHQAVPQTV